MKKMFNRAAMCVLIAVGLVGCASEEDTIVKAPLPLVESQFKAKSNWSVSIGHGVGHYFSKLKPIYAYDNVFIASRDGQVKALDPNTGKANWSVILDSDHSARLSGGIAAAFGKLFIGNENAELIALSAQDGQELWRTSVEGEVLAMPATDANLVMVHTSRGVLVALNQEDGSKVWTVSSEVPSLTLRGDSSPVVASGGVFWGTSNGRISAAIVERGQLIWQQPVGSPKGSTEIDRLVDADASPIIIGSMLYVVGVNGQLIAIDLRSGESAWKRTYSSATDMATDGTNLYLLTDKDHLVAVDARSGTEIWNNKLLEYRLLTAPSIIDGKLVVGDTEGYLHWLDRSSGEFLAQQFIDHSGFAVGPINVEQGYVITTRSGAVKKLQNN